MKEIDIMKIVEDDLMTMVIETVNTKEIRTEIKIENANLLVAMIEMILVTEAKVALIYIYLVLIL